MPEHGIPVSLETPRGVFEFNRFDLPNYARLTEFQINAAVRSNVESIARRHGSIVPASFRSGATPVLSGEVKAQSPVDRTAIVDDLRAHMVSILGTDGILRWTPTGKPTRRMQVRCLEDPGEGGGFLKTFQLAMVSRASGPQGDALQTATFSPLDAGTGGTFTFPYSFPVGFGMGASRGSATVVNGGQADAWPVVQFAGPVTNPWIANLDTGLVLRVVATVPFGYFLEVDMAAESVRINGDPLQDYSGSVDPLTAEFWPLREGANRLHFDADSWDVGHGCTLMWRDGYP